MRLGIDFGTCFSSAAFRAKDGLHLIKDTTSSSFSVPSSVFVNEQGEIIVGRNANNMRLRNPTRYRRYLKRDLGRNLPLVFGDHQYLPEVLISRVLAKLKTEADIMAHNLGFPAFTGAVLTIPATYEEHKRELMCRAAVETGFSAGEITLLEEPLAAAIYYDAQNTLSEGEVLLVYDLGGGTFDTALLQKRGDRFEYLALPAGIEHCGGIDFDHAIYMHLAQQHPEILDIVQNGCEDRKSLLIRSIINDMCIEMKHQLSDLPEVYYPLVIPTMGSFLECSLDRPTFEHIIAPTVQETINCCKRVLQSVSLDPQQVDHVLLVGGSCRIPYIQRELRQLFQGQQLTVPDLELVVCQGAAHYAEKHPMLTVGPEGKDYSTIAAAIEDAEPQSQIIIYPGIYGESLDLDKELSLIGFGPREEIIIRSPNYPCITLQTERTLLRGLTLSLAGEDNYADAAIEVGEGKITLQDCAILLEEEIGNSTPAGLLVESDGEAELQKCVFSLKNEGSIGILIKDKNKVLSDNCDFYGDLHIFKSDSIFESAFDVNIHGVYIDDGSMTLHNCTFHNLPVGTHLSSDGILTLQDCEFYECAIGVLAESDGNFSLHQCSLRDNFIGILAEDGFSGKGKIENCEISASTMISRPVEYDTDDGFPTFFTAGMIISGGDILIQHNQIHDCRIEIFVGDANKIKDLL